MTDKELLEKYGLEEKPFYKVPELKIALGIKSDQMMQRKLRSGEIKGQKRGTSYQVAYADLVEYLTAKENHEKPVKYLQAGTQRRLNELCKTYGVNPDEAVMDFIDFTLALKPHIGEDINPLDLVNYLADKMAQPRSWADMTDDVEKERTTFYIAWPLDDEEVTGTA